MRHAARRTLPEGMSEQKRRDAPGAIASEVDATDPECFSPRLTPELSRPATCNGNGRNLYRWPRTCIEAMKRARLERNVRPQSFTGANMKKIGCVGHDCAACEEQEKETRLLQEAEKVLRQIADHKRKTKEQRLASSCVSFLDALRAELRSNV